MANRNSVILTGRLVEDPIPLADSDGADVTILRLAVTRPKPPGSTKPPEVDHIDVAVRNGDAKNAARYLAKNCRVSIQGRLYERAWEDDEGWHSRLHVAADPGGVEYIDWKDRGEQTPTRAAAQPADRAPAPAAPTASPSAEPATTPPAERPAPAASPTPDAPERVDEVIVSTDGGSRGNPGPAGYGVVITTPSTPVAGEDRAREGRVLAELKEGIGWATNNTAEYRAVIAGLERAQSLGARVVHVRSDSKLVMRQLSGDYKVNSAALLSLHAEARRLADGFDQVTFEHVTREENQAADALANQAMNAQGDVPDPSKAAGGQPPAQEADATQASVSTVPDGPAAART